MVKIYKHGEGTKLFNPTNLKLMQYSTNTSVWDSTGAKLAIDNEYPNEKNRG
jgi:hypothetical protein